MKNTYSYIINGVLAVALIVLYIVYFTSKPSGKENSGKNLSTLINDSSVTLPVAYVRVDSLLQNYNFAKDINEALIRREENSRVTLTQKEKQFQGEAQEFDRKLRNNAFLSQERAEQEQQRLLRLQQDYQQTAERLAQEFALEQQKLNLELADTVKVRIAEYNKTKGYHIIFSNTGSDNILFADDKYDITKEVIDFMNRRYGPASEKKE